mmetsp:Transcript_20568/g.38353  ORF Transcript_20568/g.38353 Transcript_20568/m.38353 type:complete len:200 (-) Transcript_20568:2184-2783(-)
MLMGMRSFLPLTLMGGSDAKCSFPPVLISLTVLPSTRIIGMWFSSLTCVWKPAMSSCTDLPGLGDEGSSLTSESVSSPKCLEILSLCLGCKMCRWTLEMAAEVVFTISLTLPAKVWGLIDFLCMTDSFLTSTLGGVFLGACAFPPPPPEPLFLSALKSGLHSRSFPTVFCALTISLAARLTTSPTMQNSLLFWLPTDPA